MLTAFVSLQSMPVFKKQNMLNDYKCEKMKKFGVFEVWRMLLIISHCEKCISAGDQWGGVHSGLLGQVEVAFH